MAIQRVLVANRGEIARRVFRTCREMGISTVAVHSDADRHEPHALEADEAVHLPGNAARETYLDMEAILDAAKRTGADAIHPGYGFLSENAQFARLVDLAGLTWIGPPADAIELMGSKIRARKLMEDSGVPVLPGVDLSGMSAIRTAAAALGFPVLVKASAGGGGKGMRVVHDPDHLNDAVEAARREATSAFGDGTLFLEKYLREPHHIEIQVFADTQGNTVSLFERECSIQRRHQKIIEESPSSAIDDATRKAMGEAAVAAARAVGYEGAGTVEFLYEGDRFFFLEMNTRLQVEHPVTELVTGLDLVKLQIEVAAGLPLPEAALTAGQNGHAIEARLYAEDPANDFLPVTGVVRRFEFEARPGIRVDSGVESGSAVSIYYDPMLAKVIAHAPNRSGAAAALADALRAAHIHGVITNRALLVRTLESEAFLAGETDTRFLDREDLRALARPLLDVEQERVAAVAAALADQSERRDRATVLSTIPSGWRNSRAAPQRIAYRGAHGEHQIEYVIENGGVAVAGNEGVIVDRCEPHLVGMTIDDQAHLFEVSRYGDSRYVDSALGPATLELLARFPSTTVMDDEGSLHAPMPGKVLKVEVFAGQKVAEGQVLVVMEAMKMEHSLRAPHGGSVGEISCSEGDQVEAGQTLVIIGE